MAQCVTCKQAVIAAITERGKLVPLQPWWADDGPLAVHQAPGPGLPVVRYLRGAAPELAAAEVRMICHWDRSAQCKPPRAKTVKKEGK